MKQSLILLGVVVGLLLIGCGAAAEEGPIVEVTRVAAESRSVASEPALAQEQPTVTERLIIRSASLDLVVQDTEAAAEQISSMVEARGGFVVTSELTKYENGVRGHLTVRVPADSLDPFLVQLRDLALEVRRQSVSGQDVTEEYSDLQAQLRHLEATEERLLAFLNEAEDTEATLAVFSELQNVQREIERIKGRIQYLAESSALSTVDIALTPDALAQPINVAGWRPRGTLRNAVQTLIRALQFVADALIWVLIFVAPIFLLVLALPALALIWLVRRLRGRQEGESAS